MAEARQKVDIVDLKDKFLECPVCVEHFNQTDRRPRLLQACLHAYCTGCLQQLLDQGGKGAITCPLCRQVQRVKGKADTLPVDPVRSNLVEYLQLKHQKKVVCTDCPDDADAESRCQDCMAYLCKECASAHRRHRVSRDHKIISLDQMLEEPVVNFARGHFCPSHPKMHLEFYCNTCECLCCVSCTVVKHQGHKFDQLDKASTSRKQELERMLLNVQSHQGRLKQAITEGQQQQERLKSAQTKAVKDANIMFDRLEDLIKKRRAALLDTIRSRSDEMLASVQKFTSAYEQSLAMIQSIESYFIQAKVKADEVELLQLYPSVKRSLELMSDQASSQDIKINEDIPDFLPVDERRIEDFVQSLGQLSVCSRPKDSPAIREQHFVYSPAMREQHFVCPSLELSREMVNTAKCHITGEGCLVNSPTRRPALASSCQGLTRYQGTCSSSPLPLPPAAPAYYEVRAVLEVWLDITLWGTLLEVALTGTGERDLSPLVCARCSSSSRCWGLWVMWCCTHSRFCAQVWSRGQRVGCHPVPLSPTPGSSAILHYGVMLDTDRRRVVFLDIAGDVVGSSVDVDVDDRLWPMFGVRPEPDYLTAKLEVISGAEINLSDSKTALIRKAISP